MKQCLFLVIALIGLAFSAAAFSPDIGPPTLVQIEVSKAVINSQAAIVADVVQTGVVISLEQKGGVTLSESIAIEAALPLSLHYRSGQAINNTPNTDPSLLYTQIEKESEQPPSLSERTS